MDMIRMGNLLKELRKEKGLTQEQLAEHAKADAFAENFLFTAAFRWS